MVGTCAKESCLYFGTVTLKFKFINFKTNSLPYEIGMIPKKINLFVVVVYSINISSTYYNNYCDS